jgi:hypothetical protein
MQVAASPIYAYSGNSLFGQAVKSADGPSVMFGSTIRVVRVEIPIVGKVRSRQWTVILLDRVDGPRRPSRSSAGPTAGTSRPFRRSWRRDRPRVFCRLAVVTARHGQLSVSECAGSTVRVRSAAVFRSFEWDGLVAWPHLIPAFRAAGGTIDFDTHRSVIAHCALTCASDTWRRLAGAPAGVGGPVG